MTNTAKVYTTKDWREYLNASTSTVSRYIKLGLIPKPDVEKPRPLWVNPPHLNVAQPNQNTTPSS